MLSKPEAVPTAILLWAITGPRFPVDMANIVVKFPNYVTGVGVMGYHGLSNSNILASKNISTLHA